MSPYQIGDEVVTYKETAPDGTVKESAYQSKKDVFYGVIVPGLTTLLSATVTITTLFF